MTAPCRRAAVTVGVAVLQIALAGAFGAVAAHAATVQRHGWWSQASLVPGVAVVPPDVPSDGLYVEGSPTGPVALSAIDITVGMGQHIQGLTLTVAGTPVMSGPPVVCPLTSDFVPVEAGAWSDAPTYDCATQVVGQLDPGKTRVTFNVRQLSGDGHVRLALLAGGQTDRVAFQAPTEADLSLSAEEAAPNAASSPSDEAAPVADPSTAPEPGSLAQGPALPGLGVQSPIVGPTTQASAPPQVAAAQPQARTNATRIVPAANTRRTHRVVTGLGLGLLLLCICYWADGFGSVPIRRHLAQLDTEGTAAPSRDHLQQLVNSAGESPS